MNRHLHIVCLDVPSPADYGGAIDMLYRIESLYNAGIKIHLHYFSYNHRGNPNELNQYCESIHVYERKTGHKGFSFLKPYIVSSRINEDLIITPSYWKGCIVQVYYRSSIPVIEK